MRRPEDRDPFNSCRPAQRVSRWTLGVLLLSAPAGIVAGFYGATKHEIMAIVLLPVLGVLAVQYIGGGQRSLAGDDPTDAAPRTPLAQGLIASGAVAKSFVMAMAALVTATALAVGISVLGLPWLCVSLGLALTIGLRRHRGQSGYLAALAFAGIPLALYGALAMGLLLLRAAQSGPPLA